MRLEWGATLPRSSNPSEGKPECDGGWIPGASLSVPGSDEPSCCKCPTGGCLCSSGFPSKLENDSKKTHTSFSLKPVVPANPVILVPPVITAIGCDDWGDGNPEEQRRSPVITGADDKGNSARFSGFPPNPVVPPLAGRPGSARMTGFGCLKVQDFGHYFGHYISEFQDPDRIVSGHDPRTFPRIKGELFSFIINGLQMSVAM